MLSLRFAVDSYILWLMILGEDKKRCLLRNSYFKIVLMRVSSIFHDVVTVEKKKCLYLSYEIVMVVAKNLITFN